MKILVTPINKKSGNKFSVVVMDGNLIIDKGLANSIAERDTIIWKLAEIYNVIDIEIVDLKNSKTVESKFSTIPSIPVIVEEDANEYFEHNKELVYQRVVQAVSEGIKFKKDVIRVFELNGTGVYITSNKDNWYEGLTQALGYYVETEQYNKCTVIKELMAEL